MGFLSFLKAVGHDIEKGLSYVLPIAATAGEAAVTIFAPALSPMFNSTVTAAILAEQKYVTLKQEKMGTQKLVDVTNLVGPLIAQGLADAGQSNKADDVQKYINAVITILNTLPANALQVPMPKPVTLQTPPPGQNI